MKYFITAMMSLTTLAAMTFGLSAEAQERKLLTSVRDWNAYETFEGDMKTCYMISVPQETSPKNVNRGEIYLMITHIPSLKRFNEVTVVVGYPFKKDSAASITVGRQKFNMFTEGDAAWLSERRQDAAAVNAMKNGNSLVANGTSSRGTKTTDRYSLMGFTAAHNAITKACQK